MLTKKPKPRTMHTCANAERTAILAKVRRMIKDSKKHNFPRDEYESGVLAKLAAWILERDTRYKKRSGGL